MLLFVGHVGPPRLRGGTHRCGQPYQPVNGQGSHPSVPRSRYGSCRCGAKAGPGEASSLLPHFEASPIIDAFCPPCFSPRSSHQHPTSQSGAYLNARTVEGSTALTAATWRGDLQVTFSCQNVAPSRRVTHDQSIDVTSPCLIVFSGVPRYHLS